MDDPPSSSKASRRHILIAAPGPSAATRRHRLLQPPRHHAGWIEILGDVAFHGREVCNGRRGVPSSMRHDSSRKVAGHRTPGAAMQYD